MFPIVGLALLAWLIYVLVKATWGWQAKIPGPWYTNVTSFVLKYHEFTKNRRLWIHQLHKTYGPVVRVAPNEVSFSNLEGMKEIYQSGGSGYDKTEFYDLFKQYGYRTLFTTPSKVDHATRRRILADRYSMTNVLRAPMLEGFEQRAASVLKQCEASRGGYLDVYVTLHCYALDCASHFLFNPGGTDTLNDAEDFKLMQELSYHDSIKQRYVQHYWPTLNKIFASFLSPKRVSLSRSYVLEQAHQKTPHESSLMHKLQSKSSELAPIEMAAECMDHMAAGIDTTGDSLCFLMHELSLPRSEHIQQRLRQEIAKNPDARIDELPYLDAVIKEGLRLFAPIPMSLPRYVPESGRNISGYDCPEGAIVSCQAYSLHLANPDIFPNAESYMPERWLQKEGEAERNRLLFAFSAGGRGCIGKHLAMVEMKTLLRRIYGQYRTTIAPEMKGDMSIHDQIIASRPKDQTCLLVFDRHIRVLFVKCSTFACDQPPRNVTISPRFHLRPIYLLIHKPSIAHLPIGHPQDNNNSGLRSEIEAAKNMVDQRPRAESRSFTAPSSIGTNGHFASVGDAAHDPKAYEHGVQVIDEDKEFNPNLSKYLSLEDVTNAGFNYHLISVFGSQSTGKSTLLNHLFGTQFSVMSDRERRQTTKGIWMSKNKTKHEDPNARMADNILVMDVEGTDGRERGEDQDFERKSALFALATSEVLIVNIWEHQVGLYQGANMGLLKTVFEVNLQLFLKDKNTTHRSLLFFVIRDFMGTTPLKNLETTLLEDLSRIWASLSKPQGLERSTIHDYFDFAFYGLPHKGYKPDEFAAEAKKLGSRFREGRRDRKEQLVGGSIENGVFLPEYHRRIPADGFAHYANGIWDQIVNNKDLDLPTQQELLAQFRCDEISREVIVAFDEAISPFEEKQAAGVRAGQPVVLGGLGPAMRGARTKAVKNFETEASRYHKGVYQRKRAELEGKIDTRLKALFQGQLNAAHKSGVKDFSDAVSNAVKAGQKKGASYDFAEIVKQETKIALERYEKEARASLVEGTSWSNYKQELKLYQKDLAEVSGQLRRDEMRRLATRVERWVRSRLSDSVSLEFNSLGSGRGGSGAPETGEKPSESKIWDRIWNLFVETVLDAERRFTDRATSFDASVDEVDVGLWRLRRKSWGVLRLKIEEEMMEGNLLLKLRENFEDKFRYDEAGVPRIWRPTDDIEGVYTRARESTLTLIPLLSKFHLAENNAPPPLDRWVGHTPSSATAADEEDLTPIGGVDEEDGKSLEEEVTILNDAKRQDLTVRFKKAADGVYVEAKRSAIGGITQVPLYFYGLLLALGWNEIWAVLRNPAYFFLLFVCAVGAYVTYQLNLWGPMLKMADAASKQALEELKKKLREFLEASDTGRQAIAMSAGEEYEMSSLNRGGKKAEDEDENDDI